MGFWGVSSTAEYDILASHDTAAKTLQGTWNILRKLNPLALL